MLTTVFLWLPKLQLDHESIQPYAGYSIWNYGMCQRNQVGKFKKYWTGTMVRIQRHMRVKGESKEQAVNWMAKPVTEIDTKEEQSV